MADASDKGPNVIYRIGTDKKIKKMIIPSMDAIMNHVTKQPRAFDVKLVAEKFQEKAEENKRTEENEPVPLLRFGDDKLFERNDAASDRLFFINLFLKWGNNLPKIVSKYYGEKAAVIKHKANSYGMMNGDQNASSYLTLDRISEAFALDTVELILRKQIPGKLNSGSKLFQSPLPILMQHTIFPAVIPHHTFTRQFMSIAVLLNIDLSILFCPADKKSTQLIELRMRSDRFVENMMKRSVLEEDVRVEKMVEAGLLELVPPGSESEFKEKRYKPTAAVLELINELPNIQRHEISSYNEAVSNIQGKK